MGSLGVGHNWVTSLSLFTFVHWRRKWQPTPVFLPGESQGRGSLVGCRLPWVGSHRVGHDWSDLAAAAAAAAGVEKKMEEGSEILQELCWQLLNSWQFHCNTIKQLSISVIFQEVTEKSLYAPCCMNHNTISYYYIIYLTIFLHFC